MDVSRDQQRVALENLSQWHQAKDDFASAAKEKLKSKSTSLQPNQRDAVLAHLNHVGSFRLPNSRINASQQFIDQTVALAQPNLRVNGRNFEDIDENEGQHPLLVHNGSTVSSRPRAVRRSTG